VNTVVGGVVGRGGVVGGAGLGADVGLGAGAGAGVGAGVGTGPGAGAAAAGTPGTVGATYGAAPPGDGGVPLGAAAPVVGAASSSGTIAGDTGRPCSSTYTLWCTSFTTTFTLSCVVDPGAVVDQALVCEGGAAAATVVAPDAGDCAPSAATIEKKADELNPAARMRPAAAG
jgi:hypothetical protein